MKRFVAYGVFVCAAAASPALAQSSVAADPLGRGYVEGIAQSAFGNVTSQAYGGELGITVGAVQVFVEGGQVRNVATATIGAAAQSVASALTQLQPAAVTYSVKQPVAFGTVGVKYPFVMPSSNVTPYVLAGVGGARVTNDVRFQLGGVAADATIGQYVTLGSDLSGHFTKPLLTFGAGVMWPVWERLVIDLQYRYGRVFADDEGININRAGVGVGVRF
jgi:opacity protein-like surface antigen